MARGLTKTQKKSYNEQMEGVLALGKGVPFWARPDNATKMAALELPKKDKKHRKYVFDQLTFNGIKDNCTKQRFPSKSTKACQRTETLVPSRAKTRHLFSYMCWIKSRVVKLKFEW